MRGFRAVYIGLALAGLGAAAAGAFGGCVATTSAVLYTPITGVVIESSQLVAGHGCGMGPDQVYAYVAVLADIYAPDSGFKGGTPFDGGIVSNSPFQSIVVPCYSDGILSNLQPPDGASFDFQVYIYAYNYESFPAALACTPPRPTGGCPGDILDATTAGPATDAGIPPRYPPNWTTTCTATEQEGIPVLADCNPLEPVDAGSDGGDDGGGSTDGSATDGSAADGGSVDGSADGGTDGGGPADGGADGAPEAAGGEDGGDGAADSAAMDAGAAG
jgi:hypothetical protein